MQTTYNRTAGDCSSAIAAAGASLGFELPSADEVEIARLLAGELMGCQVASLATFARLRKLQPAVLLVNRREGRVSGLVATLLLTPGAIERLLEGRFDGLSPQDEDLSAPDAPAAAYYIWGVAGRTRLARWSAMELCKRLRYQALPDLTAFMKAATPEGRRAGIDRLGFVPVGHADERLFVSLPMLERQAA